MTYSITGRCPRTGDVGHAMATFDFSFGPSYDADLRPTYSLTLREVGAITCQANTAPGFSMKVMERLRAQESGPAALKGALGEEPNREAFQVAVVDRGGRAGAFTGRRASDWKGHLTGDGWAAAGNILAGENVIHALGHAFEARPDLELPDRLLAALSAGRDAGGDRRGTRNAALLVASQNLVGGFSLRVYERPDPIAELVRLVALARPQSEFMALAQEAGLRLAELLPASGIDLTPLLPLSTREATIRLREDLARLASADSRVTQADVDLADRLVAALDARPDIADMTFQQVLAVLSL